MYKFSEILLDVFEEMELLFRTISSAYIYYSDISGALAEPIKETKLHLLNATLDLATDLERKIHNRCDKNNFTSQIIKNLSEASQCLKHFPEEHKVANFQDMEMQVDELLEFVKEYSLNSEALISGLDGKEKNLLINKSLNIKSRRTL
jgi:hypothetical protein